MSGYNRLLAEHLVNNISLYFKSSTLLEANCQQHHNSYDCGVFMANPLEIFKFNVNIVPNHNSVKNISNYKLKPILLRQLIQSENVGSQTKYLNNLFELCFEEIYSLDLKS